MQGIFFKGPNLMNLSLVAELLIAGSNLNGGSLNLLSFNPQLSSIAYIT